MGFEDSSGNKGKRPAFVRLGTLREIINTVSANRLARLLRAAESADQGSLTIEPTLKLMNLEASLVNQGLSRGEAHLVANSVLQEFNVITQVQTELDFEGVTDVEVQGQGSRTVAAIGRYFDTEDNQVWYGALVINLDGTVAEPVTFVLSDDEQL